MKAVKRFLNNLADDLEWMHRPSTPRTKGDLMRFLRRKAGMTMGQVADLLGTSVTHVSRLEHDETLLKE